MRQVLINLLNHAIDSTPVGGRVKLVATREPQTSADATASIQFAIIDTSKQTSTTQDDKFCQSIFPTDNHRVGLGLMLVNPIVELHGGDRIPADVRILESKGLKVSYSEK